MDQVFQFIVDHWVLCGAFVLVLLMIIIEDGKSKGRGGGQVNPEAAVNLINREDAAILDVRSASDFSKGHLVGAINIAAADIETNITKLQKYQNKPLIIVCDRGNSASRVALTLRRKGFDQSKVLAGGIEAWKSAKLPLTAKKK